MPAIFTYALLWFYVVFPSFSARAKRHAQSFFSSVAEVSLLSFHFPSFPARCRFSLSPVLPPRNLYGQSSTKEASAEERALFLNWSFRTVLFRVPICKWNTLFPNWSFRTALFRVPICECNTPFPNWSFRTVLFRVPICKWNTVFLNWSFRTALFRIPICEWETSFPNSEVLFNEADNRARTDLLGQICLHLTVMNFAQ